MLKRYRKRLNTQGIAHYIVPLCIIIAVAVVGAYMLVASHAASKYQGIVDISWPQCGRKITSTQGIIGVNGGKPRTKNPCLIKQAKRMDAYALYVNAAYTSKRYMPKGAFCSRNVPACWAYNRGASDGRYNIAYANKIGKKLYTGQWWIDVEKDSSGANTGNAWSDDTSLNVEYLKGMVAVLSYGNKTVGFYSNPHSWTAVTGNWQNNHPSWLPLGTEPPTFQEVAFNNCGNGFTGGKIWYVQYILHKDNAAKAIDINYVCPDTASNNSVL